VIAAALTLILSCSLVFTFIIPAAEADETIYIRVDESTDTSSANITSVDNVTYTFTGDNYGSMVIEKDNIVVNGAG
jgi:hypothetical protein